MIRLLSLISSCIGISKIPIQQKGVGEEEFFPVSENSEPPPEEEASARNRGFLENICKIFKKILLMFCYCCLFAHI